MSGIGVALIAAVGWFVGAAIWIVARNQALKRPLFDGPACDACGKPLSPAVWLPFYGFGALGECAQCEARQDIRRPVFEVAVAGYFALAASSISGGLDLAATLAFSVPLLVILLVDAWTRLIHTNLIGLGLLLGFGFAAADGLRPLMRAGVGFAAAAALFAGFYVLAGLLYRNVRVVPFGLGDVYLAAMIGAMTRWPDVLPALIYGVLLAGVISVVLLVSRRATRKQVIPYGPYLCLGALLALVSQG